MRLLKDILSNNLDKKIIIMPIGVSGSGKTTIYKKLKDYFDIEYISFDRIREEIYKNETGKEVITKQDYRKIYRFISDKKIKLLPIAKKKMVETNKNIIYIDNTNLKKKSRNKFLHVGKNFLKIAIFFYPDIKEVIKRQYNEDRDKFVPASVITEQAKMIEPPELGEFDIIIKKGILNGKNSSNNGKF